MNSFDDFFNNGSPIITITKHEAKTGCTKYKALQVNVSCKQCNGIGDIDKNTKRICPKCGGRGLVSTPKKMFFLIPAANIQCCEHCKGIGRTVDNPCSSCEGTGKTAILLDVHIPAGTQDRDNVRVDAIEHIGNELFVSVRVQEGVYVQ